MDNIWTMYCVYRTELNVIYVLIYHIIYYLIKKKKVQKKFFNFGWW